MQAKIEYSISQWKELGKKRGYWDYFKNKVREDTLKEVIEDIKKVKEAVREQTGAFKYDDCYDDCIKICKNRLNNIK